MGGIKENVHAQENQTTNEYVTVKNPDQNLENITDMITYYCNVYGINKEIVYDMLEYNTNCFEDINDNIEFEVLNTVRDIYYNHNEYGLSIKDIKTNSKYIPTKTPEELIEYYSYLIGVNKYIALSICYNECGIDINSTNYRKNHNPAGIGPYMYFENAEVGIIYYINMLKNNYNCNLNSDASFFGRIAKTYCPDGTSGWISATSSFYKDILKDYYYYAPEVKEKSNKNKHVKEKTKLNEVVNEK